MCYNIVLPIISTSHLLCHLGLSEKIKIKNNHMPLRKECTSYNK